ncbi:MAG TPA: prenyltransferase/squalene oxidase repeat-containing protein [Gemmata sp.]|jgi:prenyltransferase beta subunit|nr:prenyltransferase/squalene oxidase repeat-containing protein [Gemmata sp.]
MRLSFALVIAFVPYVALAQTKQKKETLKWVIELQDLTGGFYASPKEPGSDAKPQPNLRATSAAARAIKYLGGEIPNKDKHAAFVLKCFDPKTGGFAEPSGKPDVTITSIGVMAAAELGIPKEKYAKAMDYLKENAKTFEDVRIGAAAVEAWGVKDCPFKLDEWAKIAEQQAFGGLKPLLTLESLRDGEARDWGSVVAFDVRLGLIPSKTFFDDGVGGFLRLGQRDDGGWGKRGEKSSDIETTYRVMRALMLIKEKPKDMPALRKFLESHRNKDGGYATKPDDKSSVGGVYYAVVVTKWLDEMEK